MSGERENFNLFTKEGRRNAIRDRFGRYSRLFILGDTFGIFICKLFGHTNIFEFNDIETKYICGRCFKEVSEEEYKRYLEI